MNFIVSTHFHCDNVRFMCINAHIKDTQLWLSMGILSKTHMFTVSNRIYKKIINSNDESQLNSILLNRQLRFLSNWNIFSWFFHNLIEKFTLFSKSAKNSRTHHVKVYTGKESDEQLPTSRCFAYTSFAWRWCRLWCYGCCCCQSETASLTPSIEHSIRLMENVVR